jgi:hypothetical protein
MHPTGAMHERSDEHRQWELDDQPSGNSEENDGHTQLLPRRREEFAYALWRCDKNCLKR